MEGTLRSPQLSLGGTCNVSDVITCNVSGLKEGVAVIGKIITIEVHRGEHGLNLAAMLVLLVVALSLAEVPRLG